MVGHGGTSQNINPWTLANGDSLELASKWWRHCPYLSVSDLYLAGKQAGIKDNSSLTTDYHRQSEDAGGACAPDGLSAEDVHEDALLAWRHSSEDLSVSGAVLFPRILALTSMPLMDGCNCRRNSPDSGAYDRHAARPQITVRASLGRVAGLG